MAAAAAPVASAVNAGPAHAEPKLRWQEGILYLCTPVIDVQQLAKAQQAQALQVQMQQARPSQQPSQQQTQVQTQTQTQTQTQRPSQAASSDLPLHAVCALLGASRLSPAATGRARSHLRSWGALVAADSSSAASSAASHDEVGICALLSQLGAFLAELQRRVGAQEMPASAAVCCCRTVEAVLSLSVMQTHLSLRHQVYLNEQLQTAKAAFRAQTAEEAAASQAALCGAFPAAAAAAAAGGGRGAPLPGRGRGRKRGRSARSAAPQLLTLAELRAEVVAHHPYSQRTVQQLLLPLQCIADTLSSSGEDGNSPGATDRMRVAALLQQWPLLFHQVTQQVQAEEITLGEARQCCRSLVTLVRLPIVRDALGSSAASRRLQQELDGALAGLAAASPAARPPRASQADAGQEAAAAATGGGDTGLNGGYWGSQAAERAQRRRSHAKSEAVAAVVAAVTAAGGSGPEEQQPRPQSAAVRGAAGSVAAWAAAGTPPHASAHTQQQAALQAGVARQSAALAALAACGTSAADAAAAAAAVSRQPLAALPQSAVRRTLGSPQQCVQQQQQQPAAPGGKTWQVWQDLGSDEMDADGPLAEAGDYTGTCFVWSSRRMRKPQQLHCVPVPAVAVPVREQGASLMQRPQRMST